MLVLSSVIKRGIASVAPSIDISPSFDKSIHDFCMSHLCRKHKRNSTVAMDLLEHIENVKIHDALFEDD